MIMKKIITASMLSLLLGGTVQAQSLPVYLDDSKPIEDRIEDALSRITVEEKVALIHAQSKFCLLYTSIDHRPFQLPDTATLSHSFVRKHQEDQQ